MVQYTLAFDECDSVDPQRLGGKCASLVALTAARVPVPPGFVLTSEAYAALLAVDGLSQRFECLLRRLDSPDLRSVGALSAEMRAAILEQNLPPDVEAAIRAAFARLAERCGGQVPVAVRSSATAEDLPDASFAGRQDTYLWVCGIDAVLEGVRRCWASLFNARAIIYRADHGIAHRDVLMAVGVQKMVNARVAGVAMTLDPGNGDRSKIVIDASWGIGELVVSGEITPDNYVVDKVMLTPVRSRIAEKREMLMPDRETGRLVRRIVPPAQRAVACLAPDELTAVARLAKAAERHYRTAQDIEWAIDADLPAPDNVVLLQSRPETVWRHKSRPAPAGNVHGSGVSSIAATLIAPLAAKPLLSRHAKTQKNATE
jgi:pyruvate, water dikinase